jgi:hypothetical protein
MERVEALEKAMAEKMNSIVVPPGSKLVFYTSEHITMDAAQRFGEYAKAKGLNAALVCGVDGVLIEPRINGG